jgi:hypothetical protein
LNSNSVAVALVLPKLAGRNVGILYRAQIDSSLSSRAAELAIHEVPIGARRQLDVDHLLNNLFA